MKLLEKGSRWRDNVVVIYQTSVLDALKSHVQFPESVWLYSGQKGNCLSSGFFFFFLDREWKRQHWIFLQCSRIRLEPGLCTWQITAVESGLSLAYARGKLLYCPGELFDQPHLWILSVLWGRGANILMIHVLLVFLCDTIQEMLTRGGSFMVCQNPSVVTRPVTVWVLTCMEPSLF